MNKKIEDFLKMKEWSLPYNQKDLHEAIQLGKQLALEEVKRSMVGMNVNGTMQSVLTEIKFKELSK